MVKVLNREAIQRMGVRGAGSVGSGGSSGDGGGISIAQVDAAYVSKAFFDQLFTVHGKRTYTNPDTQEEVTEDVIISPNQIAEGEYSLSNVEVSVGLWTNSFLSALGLGTGGGGGATALSELVDVALSNPQNGQVLMYNSSTGKWYNGTVQSGGGTDMQTVWQALAANTAEQINASHLTSAMLRIDHTNDTVDANNLKASGSHRLGAQGSNFPVSYPNYGQMLVVNGGGDTYAQLYFPYTSSDVFIRTGNPDNPSTGQWNAWKKVLTEGNAVISVGMSVPKGFSVTGSPITSSGTLALTFASGYSLPTTAKQSAWDAKQDAITDLATIRSNAAHGETAYGWGNHAEAGYLKSHQSVDGTFWGQSWNNHGSVSGSIAAGSNGGTIEQFDCIELNNAGSLSGFGGYIDFHYNGSAADYTTRLIESEPGVMLIQAKNSASPYGDKAVGLKVGSNVTGESYVQIGNVQLVFDATNNALKVINANGTAANLYATGGVSALGMSAGVSQLDAMTFNHVTINNNLEFGAASRIMHDVTNNDRTLYIGNSDNSGWVALQDVCSQRGESYWKIMANGEAFFAEKVQSPKFYLDSTRYLYINGGTLYYYNGSTSRQIAFS